MHPDFSGAKIKKSAQFTRANTIYMRRLHQYKVTIKSFLIVTYSWEGKLPLFTVGGLKYMLCNTLYNSST